MEVVSAQMKVFEVVTGQWNGKWQDLKGLQSSRSEGGAYLHPYEGAECMFRIFQKQSAPCHDNCMITVLTSFYPSVCKQVYLQ